ncbi:unnamed protein product, partial [Cuscuta epithymum]
MHPDKSPGPDGMSPGFYQHFWDVVGPDVVACCQRMFNSGLIPDGLNHTNIILIPKKDRPETIADWRPISLCNVLFKIFSKVLANRLKPILGYLISHTQSAFVPGRSIVDNIMIAFEAHYYLQRKRQGIDGYVALKLDMSKAYDKVEWNFLEAMLLRL